MDGRTWRRWLAGTCYLTGVLLVVAGSALGNLAIFLFGLGLLATALVLANW